MAARLPRIDVTRLPPDVAALIGSLRPGEELTLTHDGRPIATIAGIPAGDDGSAGGDVAVVVTAMKLSESARAQLSAELGAGYIVIDMAAAGPTADVVLAPPGSPQLIGRLRSMFPRARVVVAEIEDDELGISFRGQVRRTLDAGADTYISSTTVPHLARTLEQSMTRLQLGSGRPAQLEIGPP